MGPRPPAAGRGTAGDGARRDDAPRDATHRRYWWRAGDGPQRGPGRGRRPRPAATVALLDVVTSASLACGFHAGNRSVMRAAAEACVARGVAIGAHVSYRDRDGFGRRPLDVPADRLAADLVEQWEALVEEVTAAGGRVDLREAPRRPLHGRWPPTPTWPPPSSDALAPRCAVLVGPPGGALAGPAGRGRRRRGARGVLRPRLRRRRPPRPPGRARRPRRRPGVGGAGGPGPWPSTAASTRSTAPGWRSTVRTLCIHGDRPGADRIGPGPSATPSSPPGSRCGPSPAPPVPGDGIERLR